MTKVTTRQWKILVWVNAAIAAVWVALIVASCCGTKRAVPVAPEVPEPSGISDFTVASAYEEAWSKDEYSDAELVAQENDDIYVVALTIFAEARGESREGRVAVASVIWNRAHGHKDMLAEVCNMDRQFSCWNGKAGEKLLKLREEDMGDKEAAIFRDCMGLAKRMMAGKFVPSVKATFYHSTSVMPGWSKGMVKVAKIGRHVFYRV